MEFSNDPEYQNDLRAFQQSHHLQGDKIGTILVINNVPTANVQHHVRVVNVIKRTVERLGSVRITDESIHLPVGGKGDTNGYIFIAMDTAEQAAAVAGHVNGFVLDRGHTLGARVAQFE